MINLILLFVAVVLFVPIASAGFIYAIVKNAIKGIFYFLSEYFWLAALSLDQSGNAICAELFNDIFLKKNPAKKFGNPDETVSHVLGVNKEAGTLNYFGLGLSWILHLLDKYHVEKAANTPQ
jgi:hypothetical protein